MSDKCVYNGASIDASGLTTNGNLCAYVEGMNRVWACSAPDRYGTTTHTHPPLTSAGRPTNRPNRVCWSWDQACKGGDATTPDDSQNYCSSNGAEWCCSKADECTRTPGQINICWGLWRNPTYNMTDAEALLYNQEHYSALPSTTTTSSATAAATSTSAAPPTNAAEASASSSASAAAASASASGSSSSSSSSSSLSSGAVAGIAVGCVVGGIALAGIAGLLFWRRRKRSGGGAAAPGWAGEQQLQHEPKYHGVGDDGGAPLSHELHTENQVFEAEGSPGYAPGGSPTKTGTTGDGTHEMPGGRFA
ncbi:hypothetical protein SLS55_002021 [Diplodia seriata]|uniref:Uncharacterized protein n=1 Tax=Diplodia seriata TaxID=420778 RepID=A0ABR3CTL9_9PEZI